MQKLEFENGVEIVFQDGYLHITHPDNFVIMPEDLVALWDNLAEACQANDCCKVLNEGTLDLSNLRAYDSYNAGAQAGDIRGLMMACLFHDYEPTEKDLFFKTVAANRGARVEFFTVRDKALKWLGVEGYD